MQNDVGASKVVLFCLQTLPSMLRGNLKEKRRAEAQCGKTEGGHAPIPQCPQCSLPTKLREKSLTLNTIPIYDNYMELESLIGDYSWE